PAATRASRSASPVRERGPPMPGTSGRTSRAPFAYFDPAPRSLRTSQTTFDSALPTSSPTLPPSASMRRGRLYAHPTSEPLTGASGCSSSLLLPTPTASESTAPQPNTGRAGGRSLRETLLPTPRARDHKGRDPNPRGVDLNEAVALLPTPRASDT